MERALGGTPPFDICKGNHPRCLQKEDTCRFPHVNFPPKRRQSYETLQGLQVQRKAWSVATCLALGTKYISIGIKQQFFLSKKDCRPHLAKFASEASPGAMAGLVPQDSPVNGTIEVRFSEGFDGA